MSQFEAVIGLEVHAQLLTNTKLFCSCSTKFGTEPNENVCPVCSGMPGALPVMNERALEYAVKMGLAVDCEINPRSRFARKNYFYPDSPNNYQISQFDEPYAEHGKLDIQMNGGTKTIGITRIHMENDAGKSIHSSVDNLSFVDLNRCGVPLIEIVSEPDMRSAEEAVAYLKELHSILLYLGICDGNMEEGSFRCDANVSVRPKGQKEFGTRAELKNINSFRNVQRAIDYEIQRHIDLIEDGEGHKIVQETRLFNADKGTTHSMRGKEEAHDYRYFPDPDLVTIVVEPEMMEKWRSELPELPRVRCTRFIDELSLSEKDAVILTADKRTADFFEETVKAGADSKKAANWIITEFLRMVNESGWDECKMSPANMAGLVKIVEDGTISGKIGKKIFADLFTSGDDPAEHVKAKGLVQISDTSAIEGLVDEVIAANPDEAERFRGGEKKLQGFFIGQIMQKSRGQANPKMVNELLAKKLS